MHISHSAHDVWIGTSIKNLNSGKEMINYCLAEACQNRFILFNCLHVAELDQEFLHQAHQHLKKQKRDDALILINGEVHANTFLVQMVVLGLDGKLGEFCGNGARASAAYLFARYPFFKTISLKTARHLCPLTKQEENTYSVKVPPARFEWNHKFITTPTLLQKQFEYVETGEPHLIIEKIMNDSQLTSIGRELNQQTDLFPLGINVNAWHVLEEGTIFVKTYERGAQRLTKSCGTGSMACAAFYRGNGTVQVVTPGGALEIILREHEIELCGQSLITNWSSI